MGILSLRSRPCFPPEVLSQHGPPLLRWVRVPWSVPHLHRSYAALRLPCRFGMPPVCPRSCLTRWASTFSMHLDVSIAGPAAGPLAADGASERVTGSPWPGSTYGTVRGLPGYRVVLFGRATVDHPARLPSTRLDRRRKCCFQGSRHLEHSGFAHFGAAFLRPTRSPDYASTVPLRETAASLATSLLARL